MWYHKYIFVDSELEKDINFLHDRAKQKDFLDSRGFTYKYYEIVTRYWYKEQRDLAVCQGCGEDIDSDWNYCPNCGEEIGEEVFLERDTVKDIQLGYKMFTGEKMPDEEIKKIKAGYFLKLYQKDEE